MPITGDDFRTTIAATRDPASGPLGTFWRVDTADLQSLTTIGNPVFLADPARRRTAAPTTTAAAGGAGAGALPVTGGARARRWPRCWPWPSVATRRRAPDGCGAIRCPAMG